MVPKILMEKNRYGNQIVMVKAIQITREMSTIMSKSASLYDSTKFDFYTNCCFRYLHMLQLNVIMQKLLKDGMYNACTSSHRSKVLHEQSTREFTLYNRADKNREDNANDIIQGKKKRYNFA